MRALLAMAVFSLVVGVGFGADDESEKDAIRKGYGGFAGTIRGNVKVDGSAVYVEQLGGVPVRVLTDAVADWQRLANGSATVKGDVVLFGGQPVMVVSKATPRGRHVGPATANFDVQGRIVFSPSGDVAIKTNDGFVKIANPEIVSQLRGMGEGVRAKVKGLLSVAGGEFVLTATKAGEDRDSHVRSEVSLGGEPVRGRASSVGLTLGAHKEASKGGIVLGKPKAAKRGKKKAADVWDTHKDVAPVGAPQHLTLQF